MHRLLILACYLCSLLLLAAPSPVAATQPSIAQPNTQYSSEVVVLTVRGAITPVVAQYVERGLAEAERTGARAVVLRLDTPGGLDSAMRTIIQRILVSRVPVIIYVSPTAPAPPRPAPSSPMPLTSPPWLPAPPSARPVRSAWATVASPSRSRTPCRPR